MNETPFLDLLADSLDNPELFRTEKYADLVRETHIFLKETQNRLFSQDPAVRNEALQEVLELKKILERKMKALSAETGLRRSELNALASDPKNMKKEHWEAIQTVRNFHD